MNVYAAIFFLINSVALLVLPRRWAPLPLLVGCCYMTVGQGLVIAGLSLPIYRMLLAIGLLRVVVRGEWMARGFTGMDFVMLLWAAWTFLASFFHAFEEGSGPVYASSVIYNILLVYFLIRIWSSEPQELRNILSVVGLLLVPVALEMVLEKFTGKNLFAVFGRVSEEVLMRNDKLRAQGPFSHPILAGAVGATCFPLLIGIWRDHKLTSFLGATACVVMVIASTSTGPLMSLFAGMVGIYAWRWRAFSGVFVPAAVCIYIALELVMTRPAYYVMSMLDLTGSSTGYHRARLIESAMNHLSEWWLFGTDYTRDWMPFAVSFSPNHADITNYYLAFGVVAGLPAMLLVIWVLWLAFRRVGRAVRNADPATTNDAFLYWCLGAGLFAHAVTSLSVAYFGQAMTFFWLNVAIIGSIAVRETESRDVPEKATKPDAPVLRERLAAGQI
jgi:hypothetical protein